MLLKNSRDFENIKGKENIQSNTSKKQHITNYKKQLKLPKEIFYYVCLFLKVNDIENSLRSLDKNHYQLINKQFWQFYSKHITLGFNQIYSKIKFVQERRSKGKYYIVKHKLSDNPYLLRVLDTIKANANHNDGIQTSILREISYLQSLKSHQNIATITQVSIQQHIISILYEYYPNNLRERIKQNEFTLDQIKTIFRQICLGVEFLHQNHFIHRNLKPDNILIDNNDIVKISDFGMSKIESYPIIPYTPEDPKERERSNREIKRLWYRAPEMLFRKQYYSSEIDCWSLGCILAEMILRTPLFQGKTEIQYLFEVFQFLGSPNEQDMKFITDDIIIKFPQWKKVNFKIQELKTDEIANLIKNRKQVYEKLFILNRILGDSGIDLLSKLLQVQPQKRISVSEVLTHPFLFIETINNPIICIEKDPTFSNYLDFQLDINQTMRSTLVDWLIDVCIHFELQDETLHLAMIYLDLILSKKTIKKADLQLVGVTSLKIADVYNEKSKEYFKQENCSSYSYITADEYNANQIIDMEKEIIEILQYNLTYSTPIKYLKLLLNQFSIQEEVCKLSYFFCDFFLMGYEQLSISRQLYASCCLLLSLNNTKNYQLQKKLVLPYSCNEIQDAFEKLYTSWQFIKLSPQINSLEACMQRHNNINPRDIQLSIPSIGFINEFIS